MEQEGQWVSISEFAKCMGCSWTHVKFLAARNKVILKHVSELSEQDFKVFGRNDSACCYAVWLPDNLQRVKRGAGRPRKNEIIV